MKNGFKIAFLIPASKQVPAWYYETIEKILALNNTEVYFLIRNSTIAPQQKTSFAFRLFKKFEDWWFTNSYDATKQISVEHLINENNNIAIHTSFFFIDDAVHDQLLEKQIDIIYTVDFEGEKENLSQAAAYGLWYVRFGHGKYSNVLPYAFWEVMEDSSTIGSYLVCRKNEIDTIIYEGTTIAIPYSVKNTFNSIAWKSSSYLPNRVYGFLQAGENFLSGFTQSLPHQDFKNRLPGNFKMLFLFTRNFFRYIAYKAKGLRKDRFKLFFGPGNFHPGNSIKFQPIPLSKGHFYADPFVITKGNTSYIFFEEFIYAKNKAHISVIEVTAGEKISSPKPVLEKPFHISYPFVFQHNDEYYMVPETSDNNTVELYKAKSFPYEWEFVMYLIKGKSLIDATLHFENGLWWLFANSRSHSFTSTNDQLFLFYSKDLLSTDWKPHPQNPVATHIDNCRPAGRLFKQNGKLYRPAQNNASKHYGYGIKINEIIVLNENQFEEKEIYSFDPNELKLKASHHIDFTNQLTVIDGILK